MNVWRFKKNVLLKVLVNSSNDSLRKIEIMEKSKKGFGIATFSAYLSSQYIRLFLQT